MSCWEVLGIEPTQEQRVIKRAYAKLLKVHKPDQDPEGFKQLREAYDVARYLAEQNALEEVEENGSNELTAVNSLNETEEVASETATVEKSEPSVESETTSIEIIDDISEALEPNIDKICSQLIERVNSGINDQQEALNDNSFEAIHELDLQAKRDVSFRIFHHLAELVMSPDPSTPKPTNKYFVSIVTPLEAEFHWNVDPLIEQYFSPEQINRVLPQYFELRLAEVNQQQLFQPSHKQKPLPSTVEPVGYFRMIKRRFIDFFFIFFVLKIFKIGVEWLFSIDFNQIFENNTVAYPLIGVTLICLFFYGVVSNSFGGKGTIGEWQAGIVLSSDRKSKPEFSDVLFHYLGILPWIPFAFTGKYAVYSLFISMALSHWLGLPHVLRKDANWLSK